MGGFLHVSFSLRQQGDAIGVLPRPGSVLCKTEALPAIEAVFRGEQFVSDGLIPAVLSSLPSLNLRFALSEVVTHAMEMTGPDMGNLQILDYQTNLEEQQSPTAAENDIPCRIHPRALDGVRRDSCCIFLTSSEQPPPNQPAHCSLC
jgi:hypothetical protein